MRAPDESPLGARAIVPVFPLPNVFLYPGCVMPLHVFEPRYRAMVQDLLDAQGRLVIGTLRDGERTPCGAPAFHEVAGLGEIGRHEKLVDGRFLIWLIGLCRVRAREVASDRPYRRVELEPLVELSVSPAAEPALRARVREALLARCDEFASLPVNLPLAHQVDLLLQRLGLPCKRQAELYSEPCLRTRAEGALREHEARPHAPGGAG